MSRVGLVVEGGGTKIAYTCGVLKCLLEHDILLPYAVGISAGAEVLIPYVSRQIHRLEVTGIDAPSQKDAVGVKPLFKEGSVFGIEGVCNYIERNAPLDFMSFFSSSTDLDIGVYDLENHRIEYFGKEYVDESMTLVKASCALLLLAKPYDFKGKKYFDAGLVDMISIEQSIKRGCDKHLIISTKEDGYVRKPAPKWQQKLAGAVYRDSTIEKNLRDRHLRYQEQWGTIEKLAEQGKAMILRPHQNMKISRYTTDPKKLKPWFQLGYDETLERIDEIRRFCELEKKQSADYRTLEEQNRLVSEAIKQQGARLPEDGSDDPVLENEIVQQDLEAARHIEQQERGFRRFLFRKRVKKEDRLIKNMDKMADRLDEFNNNSLENVTQDMVETILDFDKDLIEPQQETPDQGKPLPAKEDQEKRKIEVHLTLKQNDD